MVVYLNAYEKNEDKPCKDRCDSFKKLDSHWQEVKDGKTSASPDKENTQWWDDFIKELKEKLKEKCPNCFKASGSSSDGNSNSTGNNSDEETD